MSEATEPNPEGDSLRDGKADREHLTANSGSVSGTSASHPVEADASKPREPETEKARSRSVFEKES
jgi:hypothetical protein